MKSIIFSFLLFYANNCLSQNSPECIVSGMKFTEGPAVNQQGELYFSDVPARRIYKYTHEKGAQIFVEKSGGVNGLFFGSDGTLYACSGKEKREIMAIDQEGNHEMLVDNFNNKKLNSPNDLWVDAEGGIYFTDPRYGNRDNMEQDGEHVYYLSPDRQKIVRVIDHLVRPNGIVGTPDGKKLYVVDQGVQKTYEYSIINPGQLTNKQLFAACGIDGMSIGKNNEVFITAEKSLRHYTQKGQLIQNYSFESHPTNVFYYQGIAYVTTQAGEVFQIKTD